MKCPITGKTCLKHKSHSVEYNSAPHLVCEDCMQTNPDLERVDDAGECPRCGATLDEIVRTSRVGCADCYDHFVEPLSHIIAAVQFCPEARHVGPPPESFKRSSAEAADPVRMATEISQKIRAATKREDYSEASRLNVTLSGLKRLISVKHEKGELDPRERAELAEIAYGYMYPDSA